MYIYVTFVILLIYLLVTNYSNKSEHFYTLDPKNIFFIHIPKNAGTSIKHTYNIYSSNHANASCRKNKINIAVIRHPYLRFLSIFKHIKDRSNNKTDVCNDLNEYSDIYDFANSYFDKRHKYHKKTKHLLTWNKSHFKFLNNKHGCVKNYKCIHWAPQTFYIENPKHVQYLLRFENLNYDLEKLQKLNILPKIKLKHTNVTNSRNIKLNNKIKKLVDIVYKDDFKLWNQSGL